MVLAEGIARYQPFVTEEVTRVTSSWAGLRTFAPDRCLVLGPDPDCPDFVWVAGQGGYGFQTAPAASQLVADLIAGRDPVLPPDIVAALRPDRLRPWRTDRRMSEPCGDPRRSAPAALRNRDAIARELRRLAPPGGRALEIASGSGEHVIRFAAEMPALTSTGPSDPDPGQRASIAAWVAAEGAENIEPPVALDVSDPAGRRGRTRRRPDRGVNLLHLISKEAAQSALRGIADVLGRMASPCSTGRSCATVRPQATETPPSTRNCADAIRGSDTRMSRCGRQNGRLRPRPCGNRADAGQQPAARLRKTRCGGWIRRLGVGQGWSMGP
jgi:hypothetical protein